MKTKNGDRFKTLSKNVIVEKAGVEPSIRLGKLVFFKKIRISAESTPDKIVDTKNAESLQHYLSD